MSDFIAPLATEIPDYIGMFAATGGIGAEVSPMSSTHSRSARHPEIHKKGGGTLH